MNELTTARRDFLKYAAVTAGAGLLATAVRAQNKPEGNRPLKALQSNMLPKELLDVQKLALAKKCGFEGIELNGPIKDLAVAKELGAQVRQALAEIGFTSYMTTGLGGGDEAYPTDLAGRIDKIIAMKPA